MSEQTLSKEKINALLTQIRKALTEKSIGLQQILEIFPDVPKAIPVTLGARNTLTREGDIFSNLGGCISTEFDLDGARCGIKIPGELACRCVEKGNGFRLEFPQGKRLSFGKLVKIVFARTWIWADLLALEISPQEVFIDMSLDAADKRIAVK